MSDADQRKKGFAIGYLAGLCGMPLAIAPMKERIPAPVLAPSSSWYRGVRKTSMKAIHIVDSYEPTGEETQRWAADVDNSGSIMCYVNKDYELYIVGNGSGRILANEDSSCLFGSIDLFGAFKYVTEITGLELLDTQKATDMHNMFYGCQSLKSLDVSKFNTKNVTDMNYMFYYCRELTALDLSNFDTGKVIDMHSMFLICDKLTVLDLSGFDTSNVTDMASMFAQCVNLTELDLTSFDTSSVTNMASMFAQCSNLTELDLTSFDTSSVTNMASMFYNCPDMTELDLTSFDTSSVTNMASMFYNCSNLTELDLTSFDTSNVTNMASMFNLCSDMTAIYVSSEWTMEKVTESGKENMFTKCGVSSVTYV